METERLAVVLRYVPWWISPADEFGASSGCRTYVSKECFERLPSAAQPLFRHLAEEVVDVIQPGKQAEVAAAQAGVAATARHSNASMAPVGEVSLEQWQAGQPGPRL